MTTYMGLTEPVVLGTLGPTWATDLNTSLTLIDSHNHTSGKGNTIPLGGSSPGATVVGNVNFNSIYGPYNQLYSAFVPTSTAVNASVFVQTTSGRAELYYQDSTGAQVQLTTQGSPKSSPSSGYTGLLYASTYPGYTFQNSALTQYADLLGLNFWGLNSSGSRKVFAAGTGSSSTTVTGGWSLGNSSGSTFQINFDTAGTGSYATTAMNVVAAGFNNQYYTGFNQLSGSPGSTLDLYLEAISNTGAPLQQMRLLSTLSASGAVPAGFGNRIEFLASVTGSSSTNYYPTGALDSVWSNVGSEYASISLRAASGGSLSTTPGLTITNFGGGDTIGLGGAPQSTQLITVYGNLVPNVTNTQQLGLSSVAFSQIWGRILGSDSSLTLESASSQNIALAAGSSGTITVNAQLAPVSSPVFLGNNNNPWSSLFVDSAATTNGPGGASGAFLASPQYTPANALDLTNRHRGNNTVAWANVTVSGGTSPSLAAGWNIASVAYTGSTGEFYVNLTIPVAQTCALIVTVNDTTQNQQTAIGNFTSTTQIKAQFANNTGAYNPAQGFSVIVIGPPYATP